MSRAGSFDVETCLCAAGRLVWVRLLPLPDIRLAAMEARTVSWRDVAAAWLLAIAAAALLA
jgi:hypothetical protein